MLICDLSIKLTDENRQKICAEYDKLLLTAQMRVTANTTSKAVVQF